MKVKASNVQFVIKTSLSLTRDLVTRDKQLTHVVDILSHIQDVDFLSAEDVKGVLELADLLATLEDVPTGDTSFNRFATILVVVQCVQIKAPVLKPRL